MEKIMLHILVILSVTCSTLAGLRCPDCGQILVSYPLSTGANCGDQSYKVRCNKAEGTLWFDTLNQSSYMVTSIDPSNQRFILTPPGFASQNSCISADIRSQGLWLDDDLPFKITTNNTIIKMNCSVEMLNYESACMSSNICQKYVRDNNEAAAACAMGGNSMICCAYRAGVSVLAYRIRASLERCTMYHSYVNLDPKLPMTEWPEPGIEIQWTLPREPICNNIQDCRNLWNSSCFEDPVGVGQKRCFCNAGFQWDPINGVCQNVKNGHGKGCKPGKIIEVLAMVMVMLLVGVLIAFIIRKRRQSIQIQAHFRLKKTLEDPNCQRQW